MLRWLRFRSDSQRKRSAHGAAACVRDACEGMCEDENNTCPAPLAGSPRAPGPGGSPGPGVVTRRSHRRRGLGVFWLAIASHAARTAGADADACMGEGDLCRHAMRGSSPGVCDSLLPRLSQPPRHGLSHSSRMSHVADRIVCARRVPAPGGRRRRMRQSWCAEQSAGWLGLPHMHSARGATGSRPHRVVRAIPSDEG